MNISDKPILARQNQEKLTEDMVADSLSEEVQASLLEEQKQPTNNPRGEKIKLENTEWFVDLNGQKPFALSTAHDSYTSNGFGLNIEFAPTTWLSLISEINIVNSSFNITDTLFYEEVRNQSDFDNSQNGGVYGAGYEWENSEISLAETQMGFIVKISAPSQTLRFRPFVSTGFMFNLQSKSEMTNNISENATGKIILAESSYHYNESSRYLRSEVGIQGLFSPVLSWRLSADFWKQLNSTPYNGDLLGAKVVVVYRLK